MNPPVCRNRIAKTPDKTSFYRRSRQLKRALDHQFGGLYQYMDTITIPKELLEKVVDLLLNPKCLVATPAECILDLDRRDVVLDALLEARHEAVRFEREGKLDEPLLLPPQTGIGWMPASTDGSDLGNIWVISDTHFFHGNIARYCGRPEDWQERTVKAWQSLIGVNDIVLHLGDVALGPKELCTELVKQLPGRVFLLLGNHDRSENFYKELGWTVLKSPTWLYYHGQWVVCTHKPIWTVQGVINLHGHIHNSPSLYGDSQHINASLDVRDLRPWRLRELLDTLA